MSTGAIATGTTATGTVAGQRARTPCRPSATATTRTGGGVRIDHPPCEDR